MCSENPGLEVALEVLFFFARATKTQTSPASQNELFISELA